MSVNTSGGGETPFALSLLMYPGGAGGWRVHTLPDADGGQGKPVSVAQAETIAKVFGDVLAGDPKTPTPFEIVRQGSERQREAKKAELAAAEAYASRVAQLRREYKDLGGDV